jgi:small subunit ribosomal protein S20
MRQAKVREARLRPVRSHMKTMMKKVVDLAKAGKKDEAMKVLPQVFKAIDLASKKNIIHWKSAARKKSLVSRAVAAVGKK